MSDVTARMEVSHASIEDDLRRRLNEWQSGPPIIEGSLTVDAAHAYWWFLEFGTASRHISSQGTHLQRPSRLVLTRDGVTRTYEVTEGGRIGSYRIDRGDQTGVDIKGRRYVKKLRFKRFGKIVYRQFVMHPGARPTPTNRGRGIVRFAVRQAQITIERKLRGYSKRTPGSRRGKPLPTRRELVEMTNEVLAQMLADIRRMTPDGSRWSDNVRNPTHLKDAWSIREAK